MSTAPGSQPAVSVRLMGDPGAYARLADILTGHPGLEVTGGLRGPYPNHSDPGVRWYVTVRPTADLPATQCGAAHSHQAIRRSAAPSPAKETQERGSSHDDT